MTGARSPVVIQGNTVLGGSFDEFVEIIQLGMDRHRAYGV